MEESNMASEENRSMAPVQKRMHPLLRFVLVLTLVLSLFFFATKLMEYNRTMQATDDVEKEISLRKESIEELRYLVDSPVDDEYVIRIARDKYGLVFPDEKIYYHDYRD